jgi:ABC-type dipeptide/oligopeptide/nickel transport system permease component
MYFIGERLLLGLLTLFLVSLLIFAAFRIIPGDPALLALGTEAGEEQLAALRVEMGLHRSPPEQYLAWLQGFIRGKPGGSSRFRGVSMGGLIGERLPVTCGLASLSLLFTLLFALPGSVIFMPKERGFRFAGERGRGNRANRLVNTLTALGISTPGFFLGILLIWIFGITFRLFTPGAYVSYKENFPAFIRCLIFPALALALPNGAILIKFLRASIGEQLGEDYVRTAFSKGNSGQRVLYRHVYKNAAIPGITILGMILADIFSGSIVIEQVFTIPGLGRLLITAVASRDYSVVQTLALYTASMVILGNTLADIAVRIIDPRIRTKRFGRDI